MSVVSVMRRRRRAWYGEITKAILAHLAAVGAVTVTALLGGGRRGGRAIELLPQASVVIIRKTLHRLRKLELITMAERPDGEVVITITQHGRQRVLRANVDTLTLERSKRWDRRWRLVLFDIPEQQKVARIVFQKKLRSLDFYPLQRSVYVTPYSCRDAINLLCEVYEVRPFILYLELASLGVIESRVRAYFHIR